jgi:hypothetical protein
MIDYFTIRENVGLRAMASEIGTLLEPKYSRYHASFIWTGIVDAQEIRSAYKMSILHDW